MVSLDVPSSGEPLLGTENMPAKCIAVLCVHREVRRMTAFGVCAASKKPLIREALVTL